MQGLPVMQGLLQRVEHEARVGRSAGAPAHDPARIGIYDEGDIDETGPSRDVGEVRDPEHIRPCSLEPPVHMVERAWRLLVAERRADLLAADRPFEAHLPHQPLHPASADVFAFAPEVASDFARAVDHVVLRMDAGDFGFEADIAPGPRRELLRVGPLGGMIVIGGRGYRQDLADRLDPVAPR